MIKKSFHIEKYVLLVDILLNSTNFMEFHPIGWIQITMKKFYIIAVNREHFLASFEVNFTNIVRKVFPFHCDTFYISFFKIKTSSVFCVEDLTVIAAASYFLLS